MGKWTASFRRLDAFIALVILLGLLPQTGFSQPARRSTKPASVPAVTETTVRAHMNRLASDAAKGRGSATPDELRAAEYIAGELKRYGVKPAAGDGTFIQRANFKRRRRNAPASADAKEETTYNVVGMIKGRDPKLAKQVVLLSAHLDHLGEKPELPGDKIYNGADDDASGVTAVLELARTLTRVKRPKRTVVFALFGSEEIGGYGASYFLDHPPVPIANIVANLEFEMIGRPDAAVASDTLWLTGYERSDLGPRLAAHGAKLVADPHPDQQFFRRSDNYALAKRGIIAHTVSSFGLHKQYHQVDDDLAHINFAHMTDSINSLVRPVIWLVNSDFVPTWVPGMKP
jgi:Peptidase family M28